MLFGQLCKINLACARGGGTRDTANCIWGEMFCLSDLTKLTDLLYIISEH
jgi:hypothetical protein